MINKTTQSRIEALAERYRELAAGRGHILHDIAVAEIPEMVYNSNAIENSTLTLKDTEDIPLSASTSTSNCCAWAIRPSS